MLEAAQGGDFKGGAEPAGNAKKGEDGGFDGGFFWVPRSTGLLLVTGAGLFLLSSAIMSFKEGMWRAT